MHDAPVALGVGHGVGAAVGGSLIPTDELLVQPRVRAHPLRRAREAEPHRRAQEWPECDALIAFFSKGFPLEKAQEYAALRKPLVFNDLKKQEGLLLCLMLQMI